MNQDILPAATKILNKAHEAIVDRQQRYGSPEAVFAETAQAWTNLLGAMVTAEDVALAMIQLKVIRWKNGSKGLDNLVDIAGYAALLAELNNSGSPKQQ